jgi:hypothetical protein
MNAPMRMQSADRRSRSEGMQPSSASNRNLRELHELNAGYLKLLATQSSLACLLPREATSTLTRMSNDAIALAARCSFSLFELRLGDFEQTQISDSALIDPAPIESTPVRDFAKAALFFAWHLLNGSDSGQMHARLLLGMHPRAAVQLRTASIPQLVEIANQSDRKMSPRWSNHALFWSNLTQSAAAGDLIRLQTTYLLGRQLLAADSLRGAIQEPAAGGRQSRLS